MEKDSLEFKGSDAFFPGGPSIYYPMVGDTGWHTYRVTVLKQDVKVYLDENPTPIFDTKTYDTDPGGNQLRIGKQEQDHPYGCLFDYFLILEGNIYAPGQGPAIPEGYIVDGDETFSGKIMEQSPALSVYPNPAGESLTLTYHQPRAGITKVNIYSITGKQLLTPFHEYLPAGEQQIQLDIGSLAPGVYFVSVNGVYRKFIRN